MTPSQKTTNASNVQAFKSLGELSQRRQPAYTSCSEALKDCLPLFNIIAKLELYMSRHRWCCLAPSQIKGLRLQRKKHDSIPQRSCPKPRDHTHQLSKRGLQGQKDRDRPHKATSCNENDTKVTKNVCLKEDSSSMCILSLWLREFACDTL